jgi:hypothetical protein
MPGYAASRQHKCIKCKRENPRTIVQEFYNPERILNELPDKQWHCKSELLSPECIKKKGPPNVI